MRILSKYRLEASGVFAIKDVKDLSTKYLVQKMGERERQFDEDLKDQLRDMRKNNPGAYKRLMQQYGL